MYSKTPAVGHVLYAPSDDDETTYGENLSEANAQLIAYAVNNLTPMADEIDRLREALRECEWVPRYDVEAGGTLSKCPTCGAWEEEGHAPGCKLARALLGGSGG